MFVYILKKSLMKTPNVAKELILINDNVGIWRIRITVVDVRW